MTGLAFVRRTPGAAGLFGRWDLGGEGLRRAGSSNLAIVGVPLVVLTVVEYTFAYRNPSHSAVMALALALVMLAAAALLAPGRPALGSTFESLALVPLYILLTASLPWFFLDPQWWLPAVYSLVIAMCLWQLQSRGRSIRQLVGLRLPWRRLLALFALGVLIGTPTGFVEYLVLLPAPPAPTFQLGYLFRDTIFMLFFVGLGEELLFRGIIQRDLERVFGWKTGLLLASAVFMVMHLTWRSIPELGFVFLAGGLMGYLYQRTGNLAASLGLHMMNNVILVSIGPYLVPRLLGA